MAQRFKADELAIVRDYMRQAKEVFERQVSGPKTQEPEPDADEAGVAPQHRRTATKGSSEGK